MRTKIEIGVVYHFKVVKTKLLTQVNLVEI